MKRLSGLIALSLVVLFLSTAPARAARVAVTVEKLTVDGGFIVEPTLVTFADGRSAANVTIGLLKAKFPNTARPYSYRGGGSSFYLAGVHDPARGGLLSEFSEGGGSGWMITVGNFFIRTSAGANYPNDGGVIRWQYTKQLGRDLGEDVNHLGTNTKANKDALVWKVARINAAGNREIYGDAYDEALSALADLDAVQSEINSALTALNDINTDDPDVPGIIIPDVDLPPGDVQTPPSGGGTDAPPAAVSDDEGDSTEDLDDQDTTPNSDDVPADVTPIEPEEPDAPSSSDVPNVPSVPNLPDNPDNSADESVAIVRDPAILTRVNLPSDWMTPSAGGGYAINATHAAESANELWDDVEDTTSLPMFSAPASESGGIAAAELSVSGEGLLAGRPEDIKLIKIIPGGSPKQFQYSASGSGDGTFGVRTMDGQPHTGAIAAGTTYKLVLFIRDGGDYDIDGETDGSVIDPAVIVRTKSSTPTGGGGTQTTDSSGGGGCEAGTSALLALALGVIMLRPRKAA